ncbi:MAG: PEP-CTERM sorting domain-containing protein [Coleofasciculus chthonoplastes F3-SA18-01]|uniref:PEP-CTERM sorting domain-containing protein n=1 Tax=Coleofasciculus chthonoplastes TaxID=64178 RepID=UPI0032FF7EF1
MREEKKTSLLRGLQVAAVCGAVLAANPSDAAIIGTTGQIEILDTPIWQSSFVPKSTSFLAFDEEQNVSLPRDIQISDPTNWDRLFDLDLIPKGTRVSSHFIYFRHTQQRQRLDARATIQFDGAIIGLMGDPALINPTNDLFAPNAIRSLSRFGTLDEVIAGNPRDMATITGNQGNKLEVHFTNHSATDPLRVITLATPVPEPLTLLGTATALGICPLLKRAYSQKQNKKQKDD